MTIQESHHPSPSGTRKNRALLTTKRMLLLSKFALLFTCFFIFQQDSFLYTTELIASCELSLGNIISVHAMIEVK